ncbi:hypothetical protein, partial [Acidiphilium sp.]|uniref:hypothetical protein n=1 Tax=Acidiphilium sp. TaxID=527 RepID=UPI00258A7A1B
MTEGANKEFLNNPRSFLRNNALIVSLQQKVQLVGLQVGADPVKYTSGQCLTVNIERDPDNGAQKSDGRTTNCYRVVEASGIASKYSHRFTAYYLPFRSNAVRVMNLNPANFGGQDADVFFTDTLNGCSVAVGPGANPKIGHFNRTVGGNDEAGIDPAAITNDINQEFAGGTLYRVDRNDYKTDTADYATFLG